MSKLKKLNRLNKSKTLNVALAVGLVASNLVSVVPAFAATPASAHIMSVSNRISMTSTMVNKLDLKDVTVTATGNTLKGIKLGSSYLEADTDYTIDGDQVTILASYLEGLSTGSKSFKFDFESGSDKTLRISISDKEASISSKYATFNNKNGKGKDISVTVKAYGLTLNEISNDGNVLDAEDYEVGDPTSSGYVKVTIMKEYLSTLPNETNDLTFGFSGGDAAVLPVRVSYNEAPTEATIESVEAVAVSTEVGTAPVLPGEVTATMSDDTTKEVTVDWADIDATKYAEAGTFEVVGTIAGTSVKAKATVTVTAVAPIAAKTVDATVNGTLTVTMNKTPLTTPVIADFTVLKDGVAVTPTAISPDGLVVTLTVPTVVATTAEQNVVYSVSYKTTDAVTGNLVVPAVTGLTVSSVSAINANTIKVTGTGFTADNVSLLTTQLTLKNTAIPTTTYAVSAPVLVSATEATMTVATIANTVTSVTWTLTPATGTPSTGTFAGETVKPTIVSVTPLNGTQLQVVYSEPVVATGATDARNYTITDIAIGGAAGGSMNLTAASTATLASDLKTVTITIAGADLAAPLTASGFLPKAYLLYVDQSVGGAGTVQDLAGNAVLTNSNAQFTGITTPDGVAPLFTSAAYNTSSKVLSLNFNEKIKIDDANVDETKITLSGTGGSVVLTEADYTGSGADATSFNMTLSTASATAFAALSAPYTVKFSAGAVKDSALNAIAEASGTVAISVPPALTASSYSEATHQLTLTFNKPVTSTSVVTNIANITLARTGASRALTTSDVVITNGNSATIVIQLSAASQAIWEATSVASPTVSIAASTVSDTSTVILQNAVITNYPLTYTANAATPTLTGSAFNETTSELVLTFDKAVSTTVDETKITVYNGTTALFTLVAADAAIPVTQTGVNSNQLKYTLAVGDIAAFNTNGYHGTSAFTPKVVLAANAVKDTLNRYNVAGELAITYTDNVAPTLVSATSMSGTTLRLVYSEKMNATDVASVANYSISKLGDSTITLAVSAATLMSDGKTVFLTTANQQNAAITWVVSIPTTVKDIGGKALAATATANFNASVATLQVANTNNIAKIVDADANGTLSAGDYLVLEFNKPITVKSTATGIDFKVGSDAILDADEATRFFGSGYSVAAGTNPNEAKITFGTMVTGVGGFASGNTGYATASAWIAAVLGDTVNIATAGTANIVEYGTTTGATVNGTAAAIDEPTTTGPKPTAALYADVNANGILDIGDSLTVTFDQKVSLLPADPIEAADFAYSSSSTGTVAGPGSAYTDATVVNDTQLKLTLAGTLDFDGSATDTRTYLSNAKINRAAGLAEVINGWNQAAAAAASDIAITSADTTSPTLTSAIFTDNDNNGADAGDTIALTFSEPVNLGAVGVADFALSGGLSLGAAPTVTQNATNKAIVYLTLAGTPTFTSSTTMDVKGFGTTNIADASGNKAMDSTSKLITAGGTADAAAPTITSAVLLDANGNGNIETVQVTFSEAILDSTAAAYFAGNGIKTIGGQPITGGNTGAVANDNIYVFTTADGGAIGTGTQDVLLGIGADTLKVTDLVGNALAAVVTGTVTETDAAAPVVMVGAGTKTLSATSAQITFSENIAITTPAVGRFAGAAGNFADVTTPPAVAGAVVTLTFPGATFGTGVASVVDYAALAAGNAANLKDAAGNEVAAFTDKTLATGF